MSAAAEVQIGKAVRFGCGATTIADTTAAVSWAVTDINIQSQELADNFKVDKIVSQNGATLETKIASQRERVGTFKLIPKGATRAAALSVLNAIMAMKPLDVITVAGADVTAFNSTYNYEGGGKLQQTAEGYAVIDIAFSQVEDAANSGAFLALAIAT